MKREKQLIILIATAAIVFLIDLAFIIFYACQIALNIAGKIFLFSGIWWIALIVIILNALLLASCGIYLIVRKK